jgi:hypothetical protein
MSDARIIAELPKNAAEVLRVTLDTYQGKPIADMRVFTAYKSTGEMGPTKKGVTIRAEQLPELVRALAKAEAEARALGWIDSIANQNERRGA